MQGLPARNEYTKGHLCVTAVERSVEDKKTCVAMQCSICILCVKITPEMRQ
jgi:hypothetical protein